MLDSDSESKHKKHKREHRNGSRRKGDEELEDGELGKYTMAMFYFCSNPLCYQVQQCILASEIVHLTKWKMSSLSL